MKITVIYGAYILMTAALLFLVDHWLCRSSDKYRNSVGARVIVSFIILAFLFIPPLSTLLRENLYKYYLQRFGYTMLGFIMYGGGFLLIATVIEFFVRLVHHVHTKRRGADAPEQAESFDEQAGDFDEQQETDETTPSDDYTQPAWSKRIYAIVFTLIVISSVAINVTGIMHARDIQIKKYSISMDKAVKSRDSLRVAHISDLHISYNSDVEVIDQMVSKLNAEKPDVVFVTGDLFSSEYGSIKDPDEYIKALKKIKAKEGVYWVYGNHDVEESLFYGFSLDEPEEVKRPKKMVRFLKKSGFTILEDEYAAICGGEIQLVGRKDGEKPVAKAEARKTPAELLNDIDKNKPVLVLQHEPRDLEELAANGADASFCGHTHAGQIFPGIIFTSMVEPVPYGMKDISGMKVVVSSGAGCYGAPIRVLTDSEVVIADIAFK